MSTTEQPMIFSEKLSSKKTLIDKLKPEILAAILEDEKQYPAITGTLLEDLKKNDFVHNMTYGSARLLMVYYAKAHDKYPIDATECFTEI